MRKDLIWGWKRREIRRGGFLKWGVCHTKIMLVACFSANVVARHLLRELLIKMQLIWLQEISQEISDIFCLALSLSKEGGKSWCVIFNKGGGVRDLVYIMLKTKVTPYVVPTESHYDNVSVRKFLIAQLRNGTESQNTDTSKFSAISVWFFFLCQGEKKKNDNRAFPQPPKYLFSCSLVCRQILI